jgi:hypothetical protein
MFAVEQTILKDGWKSENYFPQILACTDGISTRSNALCPATRPCFALALRVHLE